MARADFARIAPNYDAGRSLPEEAMETWRAAITRYVMPEATLMVLDLGCGTGRFSAAIADWFDTEVVGIEPSAEMLRAARTSQPPGVAYAQGRAEELPLADQSCDWAWLSTVVHHFDDLRRVAGELRRVLRPGGAVLIRSGSPEERTSSTSTTSRAPGESRRRFRPSPPLERRSRHRRSGSRPLKASRSPRCRAWPMSTNG